MSTSHLLISLLEQIIMTPINFFTFIISLILVEMRYYHVRLHSHAQARSRLPPWMHELLYRPQPYGSDRKQSREHWYYHSNQKKLMRMEAEDAFKLRSCVLVLLGLGFTASTVGIWYLARRVNAWLYGRGILRG